MITIIKKYRASTVFLLGMLLMLAFLTRIALFYSFIMHDEHYLVYFDSDQYQALAHALLEGSGYSLVPPLPQAYRLPGYSSFLAFCYYFFQYSIYGTLLFQLLISIFLPLLGYYLVTLFYPHRCGCALGVALVVSLHLGFVLYATMLSTETLFTLFFMLFLAVYLSGALATGVTINNTMHQNFFGYFFSAGFLLGICSLIRPVGHYLVILFLLLGIVFASRVRDYFLRALSFLSGWLLVVTPWLVRNYLIFGGIFFHTLPGLHFLQYTGAKILQGSEGCTYLQARATLLDQWQAKKMLFFNEQGREPNEWENCLLAEDITKNLIIKHPIIFLKKSFLEVTKTICSLYSAQLVFADTACWGDAAGSLSSLSQKIRMYCMPSVKSWWLLYLVWLEILFHLILLIGFFGFLLRFLLQLIKNKKSPSFYQDRLFVIYTFPIIVLFLGITCAYGCARLRFPIEVLLVIYAVRFWEDTFYS